MKVSYIIMPFENAEYLIRCVNSLYRQLGDDFEVILAENVLDEKTLEFLAAKPQVKRISEVPQTTKEKLYEATSILCGDCGYVQLLNVNTVVSPVMAKSVLTCGDFDLIAPTVAVHEGYEFVLDAPKISDVLKRIGDCAIERFCFKREHFEELINRDIDLASFVLLKCVENASYGTVNDVCMYVEEHNANNGKTAIDRSLVSEIIGGIDKVENAEIRFAAADTLMGRLMENGAYSELRELGEKCGNDLLLSKLFETRTGCTTDEIVRLGSTEYALYRTLSQNDVNVRGTEENVDGSALLSEITKSLDALKKDIASIKARTAMSVVQAAPAMSDPAVEVPKMYYEGRLGLKTIWRSFCGWMKYKFSGKK